MQRTHFYTVTQLRKVIIELVWHIATKNSYFVVSMLIHEERLGLCDYVRHEV